MVENPFVISGYVREELFCDRDRETATLKSELQNGNNVSLISPRRIGKTGLIDHLFSQADIREHYYTFHIDIYATKNIEELILQMSKSILSGLKPWGKKVMGKFVDTLLSLRQGVTFDMNGLPTWNLELGNIHTPTTTIDEIFQYLEAADKPCFVAIDEFQTVAYYPEGTTEALLRTYIQRCKNSRFIFSGSQQTMMTEMFLKVNRPFYMSTTIMTLKPIPLDTYKDFAKRMFRLGSKWVEDDAIERVYDMFEGVTWYLQRMLNKMFALTAEQGKCDASIVQTSLDIVIDESSLMYEQLLYQIPAKQKELLMAIAKAGHATALTSKEFLRKYRLPSSSSVQSALKGLNKTDLITKTKDYYEIGDKFFALWLNRL